MSQIEEATEILKVARYQVGMNTTRVFIDQALAKLRKVSEPDAKHKYDYDPPYGIPYGGTLTEPIEQPPTGEFIGIFRKFLNYPDTALNPRDPVQWQDMSFEACARLDTETQRADKAEAELKDIKLELSCPETMECASKKEPLYKWAALVMCLKHKFKDKLKEKSIALANELDDCKPYSGAMQMRKALEAKLKAKDELLFAYESVNAPVNPLLSINKDLERRLKAHSAGEAVRHFCRECLKAFWNVDDEPIVCPHCDSKEMPIVDPDAERIA